MAKTFKIELEVWGLVFVFVLLICLFLCMFIFGVWFGQKMVGKKSSPVAEKTLKEKEPEELPLAEEVVPPKVVGLNDSKASLVSEVKKELTSKEIPPQEIIPKEVAPKEVISKEATPTEQVSASSPATSSPGPSLSSESPPSFKEGSSAGPYYTLQVASFKALSEAERYAQFFRERGYFSQVIKVEIPQKGVWYRVYVGKFKSLAEAKEVYQHLQQKTLIKQAYIKRMD